MSRMNLYRLAGVPKSVLSNGLGRYIPQCQRMTLKFCKNSGSSRGMREFIEHDLIDFAKNNSNVVVYVKPRRRKIPVVVAEYLNGERKWFPLRNATRDEINKWIHLMLTESGQKEKTLLQYWHTQWPSIQGPWTPQCNRDPDLNVTKFPKDELSTPHNLEKSATEKLLEAYEMQKAQSQNS